MKTTILPRSHQTIILLGMGEPATRVVVIMEEIATAARETTVTATRVVVIMEEIATAARETTVTATRVVVIMEEIATVMEEKTVNSI
jgi:methyl-accepting chemotaxis protein